MDILDSAIDFKRVRILKNSSTLIYLLQLFFVIFDDYVYDSLMYHKFTPRNSAVSLSAVIHGSMVSFYSAVSLNLLKNLHTVEGDHQTMSPFITRRISAK
jgi:hypothetical protein